MNKKGTQLTVYSYLGNPKPVFIRCNFEGYPFPNVTIWFDNIQIANGTEVAIFDIITNELEDFGDYYCWSWNVHGSKNVTVSLKHASKKHRYDENLLLFTDRVAVLDAIRLVVLKIVLNL